MYTIKILTNKKYAPLSGKNVQMYKEQKSVGNTCYFFCTFLYIECTKSIFLRSFFVQIYRFGSFRVGSSRNGSTRSHSDLNGRFGWQRSTSEGHNVLRCGSVRLGSVQSSLGGSKSPFTTLFTILPLLYYLNPLTTPFWGVTMQKRPDLGEFSVFPPKSSQNTQYHGTKKAERYDKIVHSITI